MNIHVDYDRSLKRAIISGTTDIIDQVREYFSYENPGAQFAKRINKFVQDRIYVITPTCRFEVGLTNTILQYIQKNFKCDITISPELHKLIKPSYPSSNSIELTLPLRDYQRDIVNKCIETGRGTIVLATAGGKTLTMANLLQQIYNNEDNKNLWSVLIIVPDLGLVNQTFSDFTNYGVTFKFSKWTGSTPLDQSSNVIIANLGILQSELSDTEWIKHINVLVIDEVHKLRAGNKINKLIKSVKTPNRFGFTGTLPPQNSDIWNIIGIIGDVIYEKRSYELREDNYVAKADARIIKVRYKTQPKYPTGVLLTPNAKYQVEQDFIIENNFRLKLIGKMCNTFNKNVLILIDFLKHGENLYNALQEQCSAKQVYYVRGEMEVEERDKVKKIMETDDNVVCIAISKIFSTGISINNIHNIIFAGGGKAKIKILQSIGRGLRLHENKDKLTIIDIADQLKYGTDHSSQRIELYKSEHINYQEHIITETII